MWLWRGLSPWLQLTFPPDTLISEEQALHFPQPPMHAVPETPNATKSAASDQDPLFAPESSDNQFLQNLGDGSGGAIAPGLSTRPLSTLRLEDMGEFVGLTHACANTFLLHFACGANLQVVVDLQPFSELVSRCLHALQDVMHPSNFASMLKSMHKYDPFVCNVVQQWMQCWLDCILPV